MSEVVPLKMTQSWSWGSQIKVKIKKFLKQETIKNKDYLDVEISEVTPPTSEAWLTTIDKIALKNSRFAAIVTNISEILLIRYYLIIT